MLAALHLDRRDASQSPFPELVAMIDGLATWPAADRRELLELIQAKSGPRELDYVRRLRRHRRFRAALEQIAKRSPAGR